MLFESHTSVTPTCMILSIFHMYFVFFGESLLTCNITIFFSSLFYLSNNSVRNYALHFLCSRPDQDTRILRVSLSSLHQKIEDICFHQIL